MPPFGDGGSHVLDSLNRKRSAVLDGVGGIRENGKMRMKKVFPLLVMNMQNKGPTLNDTESNGEQSDESEDLSLIFAEARKFKNGSRPNFPFHIPITAGLSETLSKETFEGSRSSLHARSDYEMELLRAVNYEITQKLDRKKAKFMAMIKSKDAEITALKTRHAGELLSIKYVFHPFTLPVLQTQTHRVSSIRSGTVNGPHRISERGNPHTNCIF